MHFTSYIYFFPSELLSQICRNCMAVNIYITFACMQSYVNFLIHWLRQYEQCEDMCEFGANIEN